MRHSLLIVEKGYTYSTSKAGAISTLQPRSGTMNVGYGRDEIIDAMSEQGRKLPAFHNFIDYGTRPSLDLAAKIASVAPDPDSKVFFASGGSDAVDTAAKMARRYFSAIGEPSRTVFIAREWAYHGMHTYGTSLGGMEPNRIGYGGDLVTDVVFVPYDDAEAGEKAIDHVGADRVAGIFVEAVMGRVASAPSRATTSNRSRKRSTLRAVSTYPTK